MAIYHCNISNVSRAKGSTSCATLSYISGQAVKDERLDTTFDYGRKQRVEVTGTIIPDSAPRAYQNPSVLFNSIEKYETANNARTAKKIEVALPRELSKAEQQRIVEQFIQNNITAKGYACTYAIHTDKENNNPHAHILVANRPIDQKGQWSSKRKMEYALDENGQRVPIIDKETGQQKVDSRNRKQWKRINAEVNPLDRKETLQELREQWAVECNKHLSPEQQIDHRSYAEQGIDKAPTIHEGYSARGMEQRGEVSERCERNREIRAEDKAVTRGLDENRAFVEVLKETDSRLQDLKDIGTGAEGERRYNFAYDTVIRTIEQEQRVPVLTCQGEGVAVFAEDKPSKALSLLQATKEKWHSFIEKCRESHRKACTHALDGSESRSTPKQEKPSKSVFERFKGYFEDKAKEKAEKKAFEKEQAEKRAEERRRQAEERKATIEKINAPIGRYDYQAQLAQLAYVSEVWNANRGIGGDTELREQAFKKLGEIAGVKTKQYDPQLDFYVDRPSTTVPPAEVETAVQRARASIQAEIRTEENRTSATEVLRQIQERNKDKIAEVQQERQSRSKSKGRDMER